MHTSVRTRSSREEQVILAVDRAIYHIARRWRWLLNIVAALFAILPILAPILLAEGYRMLGDSIYRAFSLICSQIPSHSFYIMGYQMGVDERCFSIYSGLFILGLGYGLSKKAIRPATIPEFVILSLPMAVDGFTQLFGWRQSTWELRVITGSLFAAGVAWLAYPRLEAGFSEIVQTVEKRFDRLAREGRVAPLG